MLDQLLNDFIRADHSRSLNREMTSYLSTSNNKLATFDETTHLVPSSSSHTSDSDDNFEFGNEFIDLSVPHSEVMKRRNSSFHRVKSIFIDYSNKHELEQNFMFKLDFFLLTSATLGYVIKYLNQTNISTAYMNGMDEYYHMDNNEYNYMTACWSIGYFIGQISSAYFLRKFPPRYFLGGLEIVWGLLTLLMVYTDDINQVLVIRFLVGLAESAFFPSMEYIFGSWYNPDEITKRSTLFALSSSFAGISTGPIQNLILKFFKDGRYEPFQYLFLFDVLVSVPVGTITIFFNPDTPTTTTNWYWTPNDKLIALERRRLSGAFTKIKHQRRQSDWVRIKSFLKSWETYFFPLLFICYNNTGVSQIVATTYLRDELKLPAEKYNLFPSITGFGCMIVSLSAGYVADFFEGRANHLFIYFYYLFLIIGSWALAFYWDYMSVPTHILMYFIILLPSSYGQPQIFSWINRTLVDDDLKRHFIVVVTNAIPYLTNTVSIIVWDTGQQPRFQLGFIYNVFLGVIGLITTAVVWYLVNKKQEDGEDVSCRSIRFRSDTGSEDGDDVEAVHHHHHHVKPGSNSK